MAIHRSALKRHRQSLKRRARNQATKTGIKTLIKKVRQAVESRDRDAALIQLRETNRTLDKAVSKGIVERNTASRRLSRLARSVAHLPTAQ